MSDDEEWREQTMRRKSAPMQIRVTPARRDERTENGRAERNPTRSEWLASRSTCPCEGPTCNAETGHDSRSYGPASCALCDDDIDDDMAFVGASLCWSCLMNEAQIYEIVELR